MCDLDKCPYVYFKEFEDFRDFKDFKDSGDFEKCLVVGGLVGGV